MADIQVTTQQNTIEVTQNNGITVTTPTGQVIDVTVPSSDINVTTTTDNITVLTSGTLIIENGGGGTTDRLIAGSEQVVLNPNATMTFPNNAIDFGNQPADLKSSSYSELWYRNANPSPTAGQGIQTYVWSWENQAGIAVESVDNGYKEWYFNANGTTTFPTLTVPVNDVGYTDVTGQVLKFSDPNKQAIIYGPAATTGSAQRMLLQGAPGADGTTGEGGDVYIWAGRGGSVVDAVGGGDGGDVKVRAGQGRGGSSGGYVRIQGGDSDGGVGGFVDIQGGDGTGLGGYTRILTSGGTERIKVDDAGVKFNAAYTFPNADGTADQVMKTDGAGNLSFYSPSDLNTTYTIDATSTTGGADLNLQGSDSTTDTIKFAGGTNVTVTATDANTITISSTDTNTTYDFAASSTTGGANLNLTGSDSTTDTVKLTNAGHITATYTSATEVTLGSDATDANTASTIVSRDASGNFNAGTVSLAGQLISTRANNTGDGLGQIFLNGSGGNRIDWAATGTGAPTTTTRTAGTKAVLYPAISGSQTDYALGIDSATMWSSVPVNSSSFKFKWYGADVEVASLDGAGNLILAGTLDVQGGTITESTGALTISTGAANGNITLDPNGTGNVVMTFANGGNLSNDRNYVLGAIRNATTQTNGDMWSLLSGTGTGYRGISLDNSALTTKAPATVIRGFTGGAVAANPTTPRVVFERARGTSASPTAIQSADFLGQFTATGANGAGTFLGDTVAAAPATMTFFAAENWASNTNVGTTMSVGLMPTAKTLASVATPTVVYITNPQTTTWASDSFTWTNGNTIANANTNTKLTLDNTGQLSAKGNIATTGTLTFNNEVAVNAVSELLNTNTNAGTTVAIQTNYRPSSGGTLSVPQANWLLGNFRFNSYSDTSGTYALANQVSSSATENWTSTANGSKITFFANKQGSTYLTGQVGVIGASPETANIMSDTITLESSSGTDYLVLNGTNATFSNNIITNGDLDIKGGDITNSTGALQIATASNGAITLAPNGTGSVVNTFSNGGNLTNNRNYVLGGIRQTAAESAGDIFGALIGTTNPYRGVSLSNLATSTTTTGKRSGVVLRNYANAPRNSFIGEAARGTNPSSPTALTAGNTLVEMVGTGYYGGGTGDGWLSSVNSVGGALRINAAENWSTTNAGTVLAVALTPVGAYAGTNFTALSMSSAGSSIVGDNPTFYTKPASAGGTNKIIMDLFENEIDIGGQALKINTNFTAGDSVIQAYSGSTPGTLTWNGTSWTNSGDLNVNGKNFTVNNSQTAGNSVIKAYSGSTPGYLTWNGGQWVITSDNNNLNKFEAMFDSSNSVTTLYAASTDGSGVARQNYNSYRRVAGNNVATKAGDSLGEFKFNGNTNTGTGGPSVSGPPGGNVVCLATQDWTPTALGSQMVFSAVKQGTTDSYGVFTADATNSIYKSDAFTFQTAVASPVTLLQMDSTAATFAKPVVLSGSTSGSVSLAAPAVAGSQSYTLPTAYPSADNYRLVSTTAGVMSWQPAAATTLSSATVTEGSTYSPAINISPYINLQIDAGSGTTTIDLANLTTVSTIGQQHYFMVFNNTGSSTTVNIKNTTISGTTLVTHNIPNSGEKRALFLATIVGNYAGATVISTI